MSLYDSAAPARPLVDEFGNVWRYRGLLGVLVRRDIVLRYKRSLLGVWWTLLDPLLTTLVLWIVLAEVFRASIPGVPYVIYLYSGILLFRFFEQATMTVARSLVDSSGILSRIYAPAEVFSLSSALAAAFNFAVGLIPLFVLLLIHGVAIPWTVVLIPLPALGMLMFAAGAGLALASLAVRFYDVLAFATVGLFLLGWLTPTFYPLDSVGERFQLVIKANPLFHYLDVFRGLAYEGTFAPWTSWLVVAVASVVMFVGGAWIFARSWRNAAAMM
jgi:ABC-2 type transport system permease protein